MLRLLKFLSRKKKNSSFTKINSKLNPHVPWLLNVLDVSKLFFPWILELLLNKDIHKVKLLFPFRENSLNLLILLSYSFVSIKPWVQRENRQKYLIYIYILHQDRTLSRLFFHSTRRVIRSPSWYSDTDMRNRENPCPRNDRAAPFSYSSRVPLRPNPLHQKNLWFNGRAKRVHKVTRVFKRAPVEPL